jgi:hypothetical protein
VNQQKFDLFRLSRTEILTKENKYQIIARIIENITRPLHSQPQLNENSMKRCILWRFSFVCFATFVVENLPARGRKTEKKKELALFRSIFIFSFLSFLFYLTSLSAVIIIILL